MSSNSGNTKLAFVLLALLLMGGGYWLLSDEDSDPATSLTEHSANAEPTQAESQSDGVSHLQAPAPTSQREHLASTSEGGDGTYLLTVVQAKTLTPLPGLPIHWIETPWGEQVDWSRYDEILTNDGSTLSTDAQGQVRLPQNDAYLTLLVDSQGWYGRMRLSPEEELDKKVFQVEQDQAFRVKISHIDGTPAVGIGVSHTQYHDDFGARPIAMERTDASGVATFLHHQVRARSARADWEHAIVVGLASAKPIMHKFLLEDGPPSFLEITLPPVAEVMISAFLPNGSPYPEEGKISLQSLPGSQSASFSNRSGEDFRTDPLRGWDRKTIQNGSVRFFTALDQSLEYALHHPEHRAVVTGKSAGPTAPGQVMELEIHLQEELCFVTGILLDPAGQPFSNALVRGRHVDPNSLQGFRITTDPLGSFRLPIENPNFLSAGRDSPRLDHFREVVFQVQPEPGVSYVTLVDLSRDLNPGDNDLGEIRFSSNLLYSGRVMNQAGEGFASVSMNCTPQLASRNARRRLPRNPAGSGTQMTDRQGAFRIYSSIPSGPVELLAMKRGYPRVKQMVEPGSEGLVFLMDKGSDSILHFVTHREDSPLDYRAVFHPRNQGEAFSTNFRVNPVSLSRVKPGIYQVEIQHNTSREVLATIHDVEIGPGIPQDPRLDPVDISETTIVTTLTVLDPNGSLPATYQLLLPGHDRPRRIRNGRTIAVPKPSLPLTAHSKHGRAVQFHPVMGEQTIKLLPPIELQLLISSQQGNPSGAKAKVQLYSMESQPSIQETLAWPGNATLEVIHPGDYSLSFYSFDPESPGGRGQQLRTSQESLNLQITIPEGVDHHVVHVELTDPSLESD